MTTAKKVIIKMLLGKPMRKLSPKTLSAVRLNFLLAFLVYTVILLKYKAAC